MIGGDGIGPEVISEGVKVLKKVAELDGSFEFQNPESLEKIYPDTLNTKYFM